MSNTSTHSTTRRLAEGGICIALALVLSYIKIPIGLSFGGFGGSITLVMVPLILFAVRYGAPWGILAGVAFGTLKYFFAEVYAQYMPEEFMGMTMTSPVFYSVLYNGTYMLPNTILAIIICALLMKPAAKLPSAE